MLPISNFTIKFDTSKDYVRVAILLHILTWMVLIQSDFSVFVIIILCLVLAISLSCLIHNKKPISNYRQLTYHLGHWLLQDRHGNEVSYEKASIQFQGGFYFILKLTGKNNSKKLTVFREQITEEQYRYLKLDELAHINEQ